MCVNINRLPKIYYTSRRVAGSQRNRPDYTSVNALHTVPLHREPTFLYSHYFLSVSFFTRKNRYNVPLRRLVFPPGLSRTLLVFSCPWTFFFPLALLVSLFLSFKKSFKCTVFHTICTNICRVCLLCVFFSFFSDFLQITSSHLSLRKTKREG